MKSFRFFLGGHDLEMLEIKALVSEMLGPQAVVDKGLRWGARAEAYAAEIAAALAEGATPVLVELTGAAGVPGAIDIDHHGERAGEPCALEQSFRLLGAPPERWTRRFALVSANDVGHIGAMAAMGASLEEMRVIRQADRAAQGITPEQEAAGLKALASAESLLGGSLLVVRPPHGRHAAVTDPARLEDLAAGRAPRDCLAVSPDEIGYYGGWAGVQALKAAFPGGWSGGQPPVSGFWGHARQKGSPDAGEALAALRPAYAIKG